jgi:hypothetical protein
VFQRLVNYLSKYFVVQGYGVVRMNNAIGQFKAIVDDLDKAASEIADQRATLDAEKNRLLDRVDYTDAQISEASNNFARACAISRRIAELIG